LKVTKRNGKKEEVNFNKIAERIKKLSNDLKIDTTIIATKTIQGLYDGVTTKELDNLAAEIAATMATIHPDYDKLAARIEISNLHKETSGSFVRKMMLLSEKGSIASDFAKFCKIHEELIEGLINYKRDYNFDYFGIKTLKRAYLLRANGEIIERPQDMIMRVSAFINKNSPEEIAETYHYLSNKFYTHATPTLFNAGTIRPQLSSCFLLDIADDSIDGIYKTLSDCAKISQSAGGIGLSVHKIRSSGSNIKGTGGISNGLVPMLRVFDATARYVDQGGGKRKGSIAIYIEPWHSDIFELLDLKKNTGKEELRARDLFYAMWIPDLFMRRVREDGSWTLFDPKQAPELIETFGDAFANAYNNREREGRGRTIKARDLWNKILESQIETGVPYVLYKDACNLKSNQQNLGVIKSSNLCCEIVEYTSPEETAVCNLASISLKEFYSPFEEDGIDYKLLEKVSRIVCRNLNKVIDVNYYPVKEAKTSNERHRPIGIGVQGLADLFALLRVPFDSAEAKEINKRIFEVIYKGAIEESIELARKNGAYSSYSGSPAANGKLQFDLWGLNESELFTSWKDTKDRLSLYGLRNSLLLAPMPTASTAQILGNNEAFEAFTSNIYTRRTLAGEFIVVNKYLIQDLIDLGLWNDTMRQRLIGANGSIQNIEEIPDNLKALYKTVWEISQKVIIDMAADRGPFICQSQSMNIFMENPTINKLTSMHFYGWEKGLKTGSYYIRGQAARDAIKFTIDVAKLNKEKIKETITKEEIDKISSEGFEKLCSLDDPENCESCSG
jgi:ribonucleoside-diphosphate reductase alpha chain